MDYIGADGRAGSDVFMRLRKGLRNERDVAMIPFLKTFIGRRRRHSDEFQLDKRRTRGRGQNELSSSWERPCY